MAYRATICDSRENLIKNNHYDGFTFLTAGLIAILYLSSCILHMADLDDKIDKVCELFSNIEQELKSKLFV